jgi:Kdo2-lipid IVA lauroyltransferase/acyltransferase
MTRMPAYLFSGFTWLCGRLPATWAFYIGRGMGYVIYGCVPKLRQRAADSLRAAFPDWPEDRVRRTARAVYLQQGAMLMETFHRYGHPRKNPLDEILYDESIPRLGNQLLQKYGRLIVLTAHINNYEYLAAWSARHVPLSIIAKPVRPRWLGALIQAKRAEAGIHELPHKGGFRAVLRALEDGRCVGFILDQNMLYRNGVCVTYFGQPACTAESLAAASARTQAPVLPVFLTREGTKQRVVHGDVIEPPPNDHPTTLQDYTQRYTNVIEAQVRQEPESWIWMHRRWRTRPRAGDRITRNDGSSYTWTEAGD